MSNLNRQVWIAVAALIIVGAVLYLVLPADDSTKDSTSGPAEGSSATVAGSQLMVRAVDRRDPDGNGRVFVVKEGRPQEVTGEELRCERVYFAGGRGICLVTAEGGDREHATIFDSTLQPLRQLPITGLPSRTRVSPDGRYGAMTVFVNGHGYEGAGGFSTETTLVDMENESELGSLDSFAVTTEGKPFDPAEANFWGVTFARDSDLFYATLQTGDHHYLVEGSVGRKTMKVLRDGVECPSLSPDGTRIAYKSRIGDTEDLRLKVLDLNTLTAHPVAEQRPIDDQVEWLTDETLIYSDDFDVFTVPTDGSGAPRLVVHDASSPVAMESDQSSSKPGAKS